MNQMKGMRYAELRIITRCILMDEDDGKMLPPRRVITVRASLFRSRGVLTLPHLSWIEENEIDLDEVDNERGTYVEESDPFEDFE